MAIEALKAGAIEVICKPSGYAEAETVYAQLADKIKSVSRINISNLGKTRSIPPAGRLAMPHNSDKIIAMGASTGGVQALTYILSAFSADAPGTVVVQHMPPHFTASFAERLNSECAVTVKEASDGEQVSAGKVLIAPGGIHMVLEKKLNKYYVVLKDGPAVHHQKPSVEVLFNSVAKAAADKAIGVILTGMGDDGARGLLNMRSNGAHTIAQDEATSLVFGMPQEAIACGGAEKVVPLHEIAQTINAFTRLSK
jgi:two-component system chemotaxis response regulator CheB